MLIELGCRIAATALVCLGMGILVVLAGCGGDCAGNSADGAENAAICSGGVSQNNTETYISGSQESCQSFCEGRDDGLSEETCVELCVSGELPPVDGDPPIDGDV